MMSIRAWILIQYAMNKNGLIMWLKLPSTKATGLILYLYMVMKIRLISVVTGKKNCLINTIHDKIRQFFDNLFSVLH